MADRRNCYELLELEGRQRAITISSQEVKAAYRRALLRYHPDKTAKAAAGVPSKDARSQATIDDIAIAYKTLSDPKLRADYDRWLQSNHNGTGSSSTARPHHTGLETVDLDDLSFDVKASTWSRGCRCGEIRGYIVTEAELEKNAEDGELIVGCRGCSLWLRVLFSVEE